jgi:TonB family protein
MVSILLLFALWSTATAVPGPEPVNPSAWMTPDDIPWTLSLRSRNDMVAYELDVSEQGVPASCRITHSSGSNAFDARTCRLLIERASFVPPRDAAGRPLASTYRGRVVWRVLNVGKVRVTDFAPALKRVTVRLAPDGSVQDCRRESEGGPLWGDVPEECAAIGDTAGYPMDRLAGEYGTFVAVQDIALPGAPEPVVPGATLILRRGAELAFRADGRFIRCTPLPLIGDFEVQAPCDRFPPAMRRQAETAERRVWRSYLFALPR